MKKYCFYYNRNHTNTYFRNLEYGGRYTNMLITNKGVYLGWEEYYYVRFEVMEISLLKQGEFPKIRTNCDYILYNRKII